MTFDFTALLNDWGINFKILIVGTIVALTVFTLSLREFFYWFLRTRSVADGQKEILEKLTKIESLLNKETVAPSGAKKFALTPVAASSESEPEPLTKKLH